ncbi:hypothetical protein ACEZCY_11115 [Streptacidiphilus sp. N1-12]|uniref:Uncharacterized protein n=2 Tax=Streptacidiphilus alkalitolerans TaxID=3342712 RepID=A0ABV6WDF8_9ACTN
MTITPQRLAAIRVLGDDEFRDVLVMDDAVEDLLAEVDDLRDTVRRLALVLRGLHNRRSGRSVPIMADLGYAADEAEGIVRGWQA